MSQPLPWHKSIRQELLGQRLYAHHAWMISARPGTGLRDFSLALAGAWLCSQELGAPCAKCRSCMLFASGSHPDFHLLTSEHEALTNRYPVLTVYSDRYQDVAERERRNQPGRIIAIDQIRRLIQELATRPHISHNKVVLIVPCERMNISAANALLKALEEPTADTRFILATAYPGRLPRTIISRCMVKKLPDPGTDAALAWLTERYDAQQARTALDLVGGAPLAARHLLDDQQDEPCQRLIDGMCAVIAEQVPALDMAQATAKLEFSLVLDWLMRRVSELIRWKAVEQAPFWAASRVDLVAGLSLQRLYYLYDKIVFYSRMSYGSCNEQLALEELFITLRRCSVRQ